MITPELIQATLPNILPAVEGEKSVYEKLQPYVAEAERWVKNTFTGEELWQILEQRSDSDNTKQILQKVIINDAFARAIPNLDLILTPNGFGIVSNTNIAPASKDRVERLIDSILDNRDDNISLLLVELPKIEGWISTSQGEYFTATLFPTISITRTLPKPDNYRTRWDYYQFLHEKLVVIEKEIADKYVSPELISAMRTEQFRTEQFSQAAANLRKNIIHSLKALELLLLRNPEEYRKICHNELTMIVDIIRKYPDDFPEWHSSPTAQLYNPPIFENKKNATGYWF